MRRIAADRASFGVFLAFLLIPLSGIGTDIYLPSMPSMTSALGASAAQIQLTLTLFIAGYGLGQLVVGVLLDRYGRWRPMLVALALFAASSALIAVSDDLRVIWALRLLQGLLGAVVVVSKRTFFVDVFRGAALQRYFSTLGQAQAGSVPGPELYRRIVTNETVRCPVEQRVSVPRNEAAPTRNTAGTPPRNTGTRATGGSGGRIALMCRTANTI